MRIRIDIVGDFSKNLLVCNSLQRAFSLVGMFVEVGEDKISLVFEMDSTTMAKCEEMRKQMLASSYKECMNMLRKLGRKGAEYRKEAVYAFAYDVVCRRCELNMVDDLGVRVGVRFLADIFTIIFGVDLDEVMVGVESWEMMLTSNCSPFRRKIETIFYASSSDDRKYYIVEFNNSYFLLFGRKHSYGNRVVFIRLPKRKLDVAFWEVAYAYAGLNVELIERARKAGEDWVERIFSFLSSVDARKIDEMTGGAIKVLEDYMTYLSLVGVGGEG